MTADQLLDGSISGCLWSAFRMETRAEYAIGDEAEALAEFLATGYRAPRTVRDDDYVRLVAQHVLGGRERSRAHLVPRQLGGYLRYELAVYRDFNVAGEQVWITGIDADPRLASLRDDFWLIDDGHPTEHAILLDYGEGGEYLGCSLAPPERLAELRAAKALALRHAMTLDAFMAESEVTAAV